MVKESTRGAQNKGRRKKKSSYDYTVEGGKRRDSVELLLKDWELLDVQAGKMNLTRPAYIRQVLTLMATAGNWEDIYIQLIHAKTFSPDGKT